MSVDEIGMATERIEMRLFVPRDREKSDIYFFVLHLSVSGVWPGEAKEILSDLLAALKTKDYARFRSDHPRYASDADLVQHVVMRGEPDFSCRVDAAGTLSIVIKVLK